MLRLNFSCLAVLLLFAALATRLPADDAPAKDSSRQFYFPDPARGVCRAVSVSADRDLVHTGQVLPLDDAGALVGPQDSSNQVRRVFVNLAKVLDRAHSAMNDVVKLNVYVSDSSISPVVHESLRGIYKADVRPAVTFVTTRLPIEGALVAIDAVAMVRADAKRVQFGEGSPLVPSSSSAFGLLSAGPRVYISGQAEKGDGSLPDATTKTLESLVKSLKFAGLERNNIVQLKAFMRPIGDVRGVEKAVAQFFAGATAPPLILVEWKGGGVPIEIELIASWPHAPKDAPALEFLTPPDLKKSPVYSRIARVNAPRLIYVGGLTAGREGQSGADETRALFPLLKETLAAAGGDLEQMAKATYYVSDVEVSAALNKVRPEFYNPDRPPTASKAEVSGVGLAGNRIAMDMIVAGK